MVSISTCRTQGGVVKHLCTSAGLQGHFTNHSLRATAATRLFEARVDEQFIMQRTGHSTTAGVHSYKCVGGKLRSVTSDVLNCTKKTKLDECACYRQQGSSGQQRIRNLTILRTSRLCRKGSFRICLSYTLVGLLISQSILILARTRN